MIEIKILIALGGNALGESIKHQIENVKKTAKSIVNLIEDGNEVVITHGNGPQVGIIHQAFEKASRYEKNIEKLPYAECGAMSQGYIGYHLQNAIKNELLKRNINKSVASIVTQVLVDKNDKAFKNPSKPVGAFYTKDEALDIMKKEDIIMKEDAKRGYREVVASPEPVDIIEKDVIKNLIENNFIVIASGGGGIPVIKENGILKGVTAVIDKDLTSEKLAEYIDADELIILTKVSKVSLNFKKENEIKLNRLDKDSINKYIEHDEFKKGSMLPKIEAARRFVHLGKSKKVLITSLDKLKESIYGDEGTWIY